MNPNTRDILNDLYTEYRLVLQNIFRIENTPEDYWQDEFPYLLENLRTHALELTIQISNLERGL